MTYFDKFKKRFEINLAAAHKHAKETEPSILKGKLELHTIMECFNKAEAETRMQKKDDVRNANRQFDDFVNDDDDVKWGVLTPEQEQEIEWQGKLQFGDPTPPLITLDNKGEYHVIINGQQMSFKDVYEATKYMARQNIINKDADSTNNI